MRSVLEALRHAFLGGGTVTAGQLACRAGVTVLILLISILLFNRVERTFMDTM